MNQWLEKLEMKTIEFYLDRHGDTKETRITFYQTLLSQSDKLVFQYEREKSFEILTTITEDEYLELEQLRKYAILEIKKLELREI